MAWPAPGEERERQLATSSRSQGQSIIIAEVDVTADDGTAVAHGIGTFTSL